jgi:biopolymer transport protein ExbD
MAKRDAPDVNAGSMADIAFLLLIFFLVTTTIETDQGISRNLPPLEEDPPKVERNERNVFQVLISKDDELLVDNERMKLGNLKEAAIYFIDNGGGKGEKACQYCQGKGDPKSSDNPVKAIISIEHDRQTEYGVYIAVQNELVAAFNQLRNREAQRLYGQDYTAMVKTFKGPDLEDGSNAKEELKGKIKQIRKLYPLNLSEAETEKR